MPQSALSVVVTFELPLSELACLNSMYWMLCVCVQEIESLTKTRVSIVSMGPDRAQTHEFSKVTM